ncbi:MAG: cupin domain-containing protein [Nocardioidaceae bacterium]
MDALSLLAGDAPTFLREVWASHVHVHRSEPEPLVALLSLEDVDRLVTSSGIRTPALRVVRDGRVLPQASYTRHATLAGQAVTGLVDGRKALALFGDGATIVLQGLHRYWPPLAELTRGLELALGHPCQVNAYLTPPRAQGFARHGDSHDVFVFQTSGRKRWTIGPDGDEQQLDLVPGMSAYLPTGTLHAARSESDASLHVTVGINRTTWRDLLTRACASLLEGSEYDEPLPAGYLAEPELLEKELADRLSRLQQRVAELDAFSLTRQRVESFLTGRPSSLAGLLVDVARLGSLEPGTVLRRRGAVLSLVEDGDRLRVLLGDRELRVPLRLAPSLAFVRDAAELRPADLPGLTEADALVLARRLVREGVLGFAPAEATS